MSVVADGIRRWMTIGAGPDPGRVTVVVDLIEKESGVIATAMNAKHAPATVNVDQRKECEEFLGISIRPFCF